MLGMPNASMSTCILILTLLKLMYYIYLYLCIIRCEFTLRFALCERGTRHTAQGTTFSSRLNSRVGTLLAARDFAPYLHCSCCPWPWQARAKEKHQFVLPSFFFTLFTLFTLFFAIFSSLFFNKFDQTARAKHRVMPPLIWKKSKRIFGEGVELPTRAHESKYRLIYLFKFVSFQE